MSAALTVLATGPATTIQDRGRPGLAHIGVGGSGAVDRASLAMANRLVGNDEHAAGLEVLLGGLAVVLSTGRYVAVTGAAGPVHLDDRPVRQPAQFFVPPGSVLSLGPPVAGLRTYVAVAGGLDVAPVLGSTSHDTLSGLGPEPLAAGTVLALGEPGPVPAVAVELAHSKLPATHADVRIRWGPRDHLFDPADRTRLVRTGWVVTDRSDRVGVRLAGPPLRIGSVMLPSEGMVRGAIQVPPAGEPIVFLADHPPTGGYPVIGVVTEADLGIVGQARPGTRLMFRPIR